MKDGLVMSVGREQAAKYIRECAALKGKYGLRDGDRVLLTAESSCDMFVGFLALSVNHLTAVLPDTTLPAAELDCLIDSCDISAALTDAEHLPLSSNRPGPVFDVRDMSVIEDRQPPRDSAPTPLTAAIIFSSGTTSHMKPVELPFDCLIYAQEQNSATFYLDRFPRKYAGMTAFPLTHVSGLCFGTAIFLSGRTMAFIDDLTASAMQKSFQIFKPVVFAMIPKVFDLLAEGLTDEIKKRGKYELFMRLRRVSSFFRRKLGIRAVGRLIMTPFRRPLFGKNFKGIGGGGTPWKPETPELFLDLGIRYTNLYTTTECAFYIASTGQEKDPPLDAIAKADSNKHGEVFIAEPDTDGIGEIRVKTRFIMNGYYGDPESTKAAFDEFGRFRTGDLGRIGENGYLYITGRKKEAILLHSGKKTAPADLADLFGPVLGKTDFAFIGVPAGDSGCDEIHLFIGTRSCSGEDINALDERVLDAQRRNAPLLPIRKIHHIPEIPRTRIGKVKTYLLKEMAGRENASGEHPNITGTGCIPPMDTRDVPDDILAKVIRLIREHGHVEREITGSEDLVTGLGIDSLDLISIAVAVEDCFGIRLPEASDDGVTAAGIAEYVRSAVHESPAEAEIDTVGSGPPQYPRKRSAFHKGTYRLLRRLAAGLYDFDVSGLENVSPDEHYIFCPNHVTYLDGLWLCTALDSHAADPEHIGSLAKQSLMRHAFTRFCVTLFGAVPIDQDGNPTAALSQLSRFVKDGNDVMIYPEGTRTSDGRLGEFRNGAARVSVMTGARIIPVAAYGGYDIYPRTSALPRIRDKNHRKPKLRFAFCEPVDPAGKTPEEIMRLVRNAVKEKLDDFADEEKEST